MTAGEPPADLAGRDQWIAWRNECRECGSRLDPSIKVCEDCDEKTTKRPVDPSTGEFAKTNDPSTWASLEAAREFHDEHDTHGIGFVFAEDDGIAGVDLDDCRDPETGDLEDWAIDIVTHLASFTEVSPSGTGLHIYVYGEIPEGGNRREGVEMYDSERYFTVTGDRIPRSPGAIGYRQDELAAVHEDRIRGAGSGGSEIVDFSLEIERDVDVETFTNDLGSSLEEIRDRDDKLDQLLTDVEAGYESPSEADMAAVSKLWFRRFDRQDIARILRTYRKRPKTVERNDYLELTIAKAATGEQYDPRSAPLEDVEILEDRTHYRSIDGVDFPDDGHFVLDKPPREGGSHAAIKHLAERRFVGLVSRHAIAEHHLSILDDVLPDGACAVHLMGSARACDSSSGECSKATETLEERYELEHEAMDAVERKRHVTAEDCPEGFCKHQFLKLAEKHAHAVVTVPQLIEQLERDVDECSLLIDEEQALGYFRPDSTTLVEVEQVWEPDGTQSIQVASANLRRQFRAALEDIRDAVFEEQERRKEQAEAEGRDWRRNSWEIDIEHAVDYLEELQDALGVTDVVEHMARNDERITTKAVLDRLRDRAAGIERPEPHTSPEKFRGKLSEYTAPYYHNDLVDPGAMIEAALFPYGDRPFDFKKTGQAHTLRMIAGREVFHADTLRRFEQIGVIAGPEGELLFDDLDLEAEVIVIDEFRYSGSFVVAPLAREVDGELEAPRTQRRRAKRVSQKLNERSHPHLAIAGTKERAEDHHSNLSGTADTISNPTSPAKDVFATWSAGATAIIYENSAVSRGIDAPPFDVSVVVSSEFATPYWEARQAHHDGEDADEFQRAASIEAQIKARELTNAVLRPAPTPAVEDHYGTKFIVCSAWDVGRLKYLEERTLPRFAYAKSVANVLEQLTVGGGLRIAIDEMYEESGGDERMFIENATREELKEVQHTRPTYELDEVTTWRENRYFFDGSECDRILGMVARLADAPTTGEVAERFSAWKEGRVSAALKTLERKGIVTKEKENDGSDGPPKLRWKLG